MGQHVPSDIYLIFIPCGIKAFTNKRAISLKYVLEQSQGFRKMSSSTARLDCGRLETACLLTDMSSF